MTPQVRRGPRALAAAAASAVGGVLAAAMVALPTQPGGLTGVVDEHMEASGVTHGVTAVLLNFRAYDTWLEIAILLLAAVAVLAVAQAGDVPGGTGGRVSLLQREFTRWTTPVLVLVGIYLLSRGTFAAGGAFQAGAVLAAAALLLWVSGYRSVSAVTGSAARLALLAGFGAFLVFATLSNAAGRAMLAYPPNWAGPGIMALEVAVTLSVAFTLAFLFVAGRHAGEGRGPGQT